MVFKFKIYKGNVLVVHTAVWDEGVKPHYTSAGTGFIFGTNDTGVCSQGDHLVISKSGIVVTYASSEKLQRDLARIPRILEVINSRKDVNHTIQVLDSDGRPFFG